MAVIPGTDGADQLDGTAEADVIRGLGDQDTLSGLAGDDVLRGGADTDFLNGGDGDDRMLGGAGNDFGVFTLAPSGVTIDLERGFARGWGNDFLRGIENIDGSLKDDVIRLDDGDNFANGNDGRDRIFGLGGNDRLFGAAGDDRLAGGVGDDELTGDLGDDLLRGGPGTDKLDGGDGTDTASWADLDVAIQASLAAGTATGAGVSTTLTDIESLRGSRAGDELAGDIVANILAGGLGDDVLRGDVGDDILIGGAGADRLAGNSGADTYRFDRLTDSLPETPDTIEDFFPAGESDRIDVSRIDGDVTQDGRQGFTLTATLSGPGQVAAQAIDGQGMELWFNVDADLEPEMVVRIGTIVNLPEGWLIDATTTVT